MLLIRIGKSISAIKNNGWIRGVPMILGGLKKFVCPVKKGDVLFITGGAGDSTRYRAFHQAEELELNEIKSAIVLQDHWALLSLVKKFKVFVFHRTFFSPKIKKMIAKIKEQKREIIFETDDLIYDPKFLPHMDYYQKLNSLEKKLYENGLGGEILRDPYVKVCTTTTNFLKEKLEEEGKKVFLVKNKLSKEDVLWASEIARQRAHQKVYSGEKDSIIKLGYFSGTISHNKDFDSIRPALEMILRKNSNVELHLAGPLDIDDDLNQKFSEQIKRIPFAPRKEHFENISQMDINLAPLEIDNPFCQAKSELKFFEAGILEIPTVASGTDTFLEAIEDGVDGFVAKNEKEWEEKLQRLIDDQELRERMGKRAREKTSKNHTTEKANNQEYYEYLKGKIGGGNS